MSDTQGRAVIGSDAVIKGKIRNGRLIEVHGYIEGDITAEKIVVHNGGRVFGKLKAQNAEVNGTVQGDVAIRELISIGSSGSVSGNVRYGRLALAQGGDLSADVRNIPPEIAGDLDITVRRGGTTRITPVDLTAIDPDDPATSLTFEVSNVGSGFVALGSQPAVSVTTFKLTELEAGNVIYSHDGSDGDRAAFDVVVSDASGATSGAAQTVTVRIRD